MLLALVLLASCSRKADFDENVLIQVSNRKVSGFDPIYSTDLYSNREIGKVYEGLFEFHPLKRPYELKPNLLKKMPQASKDGLKYSFTLREDVFFHDSPCFKDGKGRNLVAEDVFYSLKRLADPKLQSNGWWVVQNKIKGLDEWREANSKSEKTDYSAAIPGFVKTGKYTFDIILKKPTPLVLYAFAMGYTFVVAKEAVETFDKDFINTPVGTGPFVLPKFDQSNKIVYQKNPNFRKKVYPSEGAPGDAEKGLLDDAGKQVPLVEKIIVLVETEDQPRWLNFRKGNTDYIEIPKDNFDQAVVDGKIAPDLKERGIKLELEPQLDTVFFAFNTENEYLKNVKLRRAMSLAFDRDELNKLFYNNTALVSNGPVPPGLKGYDKDFRNPYVQYDVEKAKKLLAEAGYPNGEGLPPITYDTLSATTYRQTGEFIMRSMAKIGVQIKLLTNTWPELVKKVHSKNVQIYGMAWGADYPDAENYLQLLYSKNISPGSNGANYNNPKFDQMFEKATVMEDSPERTKLYEELNQYVGKQVPWIFGVHRKIRIVKHGWLKNFKYIEFDHAQAQYLKVDLEVKKKLADKF